MAYLFPVVPKNKVYQSGIDITEKVVEAWYIASVECLIGYGEVDILWEPGEQTDWCFKSKIDCQIACNSLMSAGYNTYEKLEDLADNHPEEFKRIACENLRW